MASKRALVVGGTSGIGHGIALALAKRGNIEVSIAGRSASRGAEIVAELQTASPPDSAIQHSFYAVDAFDLKSVKNLSENVTVEGKAPFTEPLLGILSGDCT